MERYKPTATMGFQKGKQTVIDPKQSVRLTHRQVRYLAKAGGDTMLN